MGFRVTVYLGLGSKVTVFQGLGFSVTEVSVWVSRLHCVWVYVQCYIVWGLGFRVTGVWG